MSLFPSPSDQAAATEARERHAKRYEHMRNSHPMSEDKRADLHFRYWLSCVLRVRDGNIPGNPEWPAEWHDYGEFQRDTLDDYTPYFRITKSNPERPLHFHNFRWASPLNDSMAPTEELQ